MAKFLSQDQINEYKECFSLYDQKRIGKMKTQDLLTVMRSLGRCPTLPELDRHLLAHNIEHCSTPSKVKMINVQTISVLKSMN